MNRYRLPLVVACVLSLVVSLGGCAYGSPSSTTDFVYAVNQAIPTKAQLVSHTSGPGWGAGTWEFRDENGVDFTCTAGTGSTSMPFTTQWENSCNYGIAWLRSQTGGIQNLFGDVQIDTSGSAFPKWGHHSVVVSVSAWDELPGVARAVVDTLNQFVIPLRKTWVNHVQFYVPTLNIVAGGNYPELRRDDFHTTGDPGQTPEYDTVLNEIRYYYVDLVLRGKIRDDTVPADVLATQPALSVYVSYDNKNVFDMRYDLTRLEYMIRAEPFCFDSAGTSSTSSLKSWVKQLGGDYSESDCKATWTLNGHTWDVTQNKKTPLDSRPTVKKDGTPLTLSSHGYTNTKYKGHDYAQYVFTMSDMEQLLGASIVMDENRKTEATIVF